MKPFYMVRILLDAAKMMRIARRPALRNRPLDPGYLAHSALRELFGDTAPAPFAVVSEKGRKLEVLGYTDLDSLRLKNGAPPLLAGDPRFKEMPKGIKPGTRYRFRLRACPTVRQGRPKGHRTEPNSEIDAYLAAIERPENKGKRPLREEIYRQWLIKRFAETAELESVRLCMFRLASFLRRDSRRDGKPVLRPDVVFEGILKVGDPERFATILRRGLGRHKAFGFGMVLIKRP